jgi:hypothetical protein
VTDNPLEYSADTTAVHCYAFLQALERVGFDRAESVSIVAAWMSRPAPAPSMDAATTNAVMQNFADRFMGSE